MSTENRLKIVENRQGAAKKVLCVCYGGYLRSPTTAWVLSQDPYNFNTRSCGVDQNSALVLLDSVLLNWCDEIVTMEELHRQMIISQMPVEMNKPIKVLNIFDNYQYRQPELVQLVKERYDGHN